MDYRPKPTRLETKLATDLAPSDEPIFGPRDTALPQTDVWVIPCCWPRVDGDCVRVGGADLDADAASRIRVVEKILALPRALLMTPGGIEPIRPAHS
jgi:hypothetical protein